MLAQHEVQLHDYPEGVTPPGGIDKGKGIAGLKLLELQTLLEAFEGPYPPFFRPVSKPEDKKGKFITSI